MAHREIALRFVPTSQAVRRGIIAHRALVGAGGEAACGEMLKGRGLGDATLQLLDDTADAWATLCAGARVLAIPRQDDGALSDEAWDLLLIALSTGLPVVSTRRGGLAPFLTHGVEGYVASTEHDAPLDLSPAAAKLLTDDTLFHRFSRGACARVLISPCEGGVVVSPVVRAN